MQSSKKYIYECKFQLNSVDTMVDIISRYSSCSLFSSSNFWYFLFLACLNNRSKFMYGYCVRFVRLTSLSALSHTLSVFIFKCRSRTGEEVALDGTFRNLNSWQKSSVIHFVCFPNRRDRTHERGISWN
jgi:hypothetical protein